MRKFTKEQKVYTIAGVEIGGQPGERPTVLVGSIFFSRHQIVIDPLKGIFDQGKAQKLLECEKEVATYTGVPRIIDPIGETAQALINYIEFVVFHTDAPILVDSPSQKVRLETIKHFAGSEVTARLIYNSIGEDFTEEELACIKECGVTRGVRSFQRTFPVGENTETRHIGLSSSCRICLCTHPVSGGRFSPLWSYTIRSLGVSRLCRCRCYDRIRWQIQWDTSCDSRASLI